MTDDRARRLAELRRAYENGTLDENAYRVAVAALGAEEGQGAIAIGPGAMAAGDHGVVIGGSVQGGLIITGDGVVVEEPGEPQLPAECPNCGAPIRPDDVAWLGDTAVACSHCGGTIKAIIDGR